MLEVGLFSLTAALGCDGCCDGCINEVVDEACDEHSDC